MVKRVYDTSSLINIWDRYPLSSGLFPDFWAWLLASFQSGESVIPAAAFAELEVERKDFAKLLLAKGVKPFIADEEMKEFAGTIPAVMGVGSEGFSSSGVSGADMVIIATAKILQAEVICEEHQPDDPGKARNAKVPRVCRDELVKVKCWNFQEMLADYTASLQR